VANTEFVFPMTVHLYDVDVRAEASCAAIFRYFEETAMRGSAHFGFTFDWYQAQGQFWVIRTMRMERLCAPRYLDELEIRTWVSSMGRVRSDRNYEVRRRSDGKRLARGIANWVYVDAAKTTPSRIHPEIAAMFEKHDPPALPPLVKLTLHPERPALYEHTGTRRAQFFEADSALHTNHTVYVNWLEESIREALQTIGYPLALDNATPLPWFYRHALEYARPALPGDPVEICTRLLKQTRAAGTWEVEMLHAGTRETLLRAETTMVWVDAANRLVPWAKLARER
jgi:acyl-CoA thioesterase FadM